LKLATSLALTVALPLSVAAPGRAGPISPPFADWTYSTEFSTIHWFPGSSEPRDTQGTLHVNSISLREGNIWLGRTQPTRVETASGDSSDVRLSKITGENPNYLLYDIFFERDFTMTLSLTDNASGATGSLRFSGYVNAALLPEGDDTLGDGALFWLIFSGPTTQSLELGEFGYTVTVRHVPSASYASHFGDYDLGEIRAEVEAHPLSVLPAPEPSSLLLAGSGISLLGLFSWRRRRGGARSYFTAARTQRKPRLSLRCPALRGSRAALRQPSAGVLNDPPRTTCSVAARSIHGLPSAGAPL
jgi:hypothetical protein